MCECHPYRSSWDAKLTSNINHACQLCAKKNETSHKRQTHPKRKISPMPTTLRRRCDAAQCSMSRKNTLFLHLLMSCYITTVITYLGNSLNDKCGVTKWLCKKVQCSMKFFFLWSHNPYHFENHWLKEITQCNFSKVRYDMRDELVKMENFVCLTAVCEAASVQVSQDLRIIIQPRDVIWSLIIHFKSIIIIV